LISCEELIGEFDEEKSIISNPVVMIPVSKEQIAFQPWLPYSEDKDYNLKENQIVLVASPSETIRKEYDRIYGSGLVTPSSHSIVM
tara:strand:+ start:546 stop:803 length:258 start_codon:yes stop_codon:yes gene_type:complete